MFLEYFYIPIENNIIKTLSPLYFHLWVPLGVVVMLVYRDTVCVILFVLFICCFSGVDNSNANSLGLKRNTWLRTSLRRTTNGNRYVISSYNDRSAVVVCMYFILLYLCLITCACVCFLL